MVNVEQWMMSSVDPVFLWKLDTKLSKLTTFQLISRFFLEQVKKVLKIEFNDECTYQCRHIWAKNLDSRDILICRLYAEIRTKMVVLLF